jgi:hypothetical protein
MAGNVELGAAPLNWATAGADATRDKGINALRTGDGSRPLKELNRTRLIEDCVGRSVVREGGVDAGDWDWERGLSGEGVRGKDDEGSGERLGGELERGNVGDGAAFDIPAELGGEDE